MLAKKNRLTVEQFTTHFKRGRHHNGQYLSLLYSPNDNFYGAVVVGKKIFKKAVQRNRLRRQLYPVLLDHHQQTKQTGVFLCLVKTKAAQATSDEVKDDLRQQLARLSLAS